MIRLCYLATYFLLVFFFHFGCHIVIMFFWRWFLHDTIDVPYFFHKQWQVYPRFVRLAYLGTPFYIRVRQLHNKVYFAYGLQHLRKDLQIYESVTITFMAMENKYTFDIFFHPRSTPPELREAILVLKRVCLDNRNFTVNAWWTATPGNHKNLFEVPYTHCCLYMTVFFLPCRDFQIVPCHM